jgi:cytochrome c oxidase cbb3-type subunit III
MVGENRANSSSVGRFAGRACALGGWLALVLAGCDFPGKPKPKDRPVTPDQIVKFELLYRQNCSGCHGADGKLGPAPPLNDPAFRAIVSDADLLLVIREGRHGTPMPAFARDAGGPLTAAQIDALAVGIKSHWESAARPDEPWPAYRLTKADDLQSDTGNRERGAELFARACAGCHGPSGKGGPGDEAPGGAINDPAFLALISNQALRRIMITGREDLGMPNYAETDGRPSDFQSLTSDQIDDLLALLASWRTERDTSALNRQAMTSNRDH